MGILFRVPPTGAIYGARGYFHGGETTVSMLNSFVFSTETIGSMTLTINRRSGAGVNSTLAGYVGGGIAAFAYATTMAKLQFSSETQSETLATVSQSRFWNTSVNSADDGYFLCGQTSSPASSATGSIDGIAFSTDSAINPTASISPVRSALPAGVNSTLKGYVLGGRGTTGTTITDIAGFNFSNETTFDPSTNLATQREGSAGFNSTTVGYAAAGFGLNSIINTIVRLPFDTETVSELSATAGTARTMPGGVNSTTVGYIAGGLVTVTPSVEITGLTFSTETAIDPLAALSTANYSMATYQSGSL